MTMLEKLRQSSPCQLPVTRERTEVNRGLPSDNSYLVSGAKIEHKSHLTSQYALTQMISPNKASGNYTDLLL